MEKKLKEFLEQYLGRGTEKCDIVTQEDVDNLLATAELESQNGLSKKIIEYGTKNPNAPFWDFLSFIKPGLDGITQEELLEDDEDD